MMSHQQLQALRPVQHVGTRSYYDAQVRETISDVKPIGVDADAVLVQMSEWWLSQSAPRKRLAFVAWAWRLVRTIWRLRRTYPYRVNSH